MVSIIDSYFARINWHDRWGNPLPEDIFEPSREDVIFNEAIQTTHFGKIVSPLIYIQNSTFQQMLVKKHVLNT